MTPDSIRKSLQRRSRIETLQAQVHRLGEALRFYADADVLYLGAGDWQTPLSDLTCDNGSTARRALADVKWEEPKIEIRKIILTYTNGRTEEWSND